MNLVLTNEPSAIIVQIHSKKYMFLYVLVCLLDKGRHDHVGLQSILWVLVLTTYSAGTVTDCLPACLTVGAAE